MNRFRLWLLYPVLASAAASAAPAPPAATSLELGVGAVVLTVPDYRGSDRSDVQAYPLPYAVYHSEHVQLSRQGLRAKVFSLDQLSLSISAALNLTTRRSNPDRAGMPKLATTVEVGPSLDYRIDEGERWSLRARLPVRGAVSADGFKWVGLVVDPHLRFDLEQPLAHSRMFYGASLGAVAASGEYHQYYYGVATPYATASRPSYEAHGGYAGLHATASAAWRIRRWRLAAFVYDDWMEGASFVDSPLLKTRNNLEGGVLVTYRLYARGREYLGEDD